MLSSNIGTLASDYLNITRRRKDFFFCKNQNNILTKVSSCNYDHRKNLKKKKIRAITTITNYGGGGEGYGKINIGGGDSIRLPKKKIGFVPRYELTHTDAVKLQMKVN